MDEDNARGGAVADSPRSRGRLRALLRQAVEQAYDAIVVTDADGRIQYVNPAFERITGYSAAEAVGRKPSLLRSGRHGQMFYREMWTTIKAGDVFHGRFINRRKDGRLFNEEGTISPIRDDRGRITNFIAVKRDVTQITAMEIQLLQGQKMEAIGQLAAGIAHEINTPSQYVGDNIHFLRDAFAELGELVGLYRGLAEAAQRGELDDEARAAARRRIDTLDETYLMEEIPRSIDQSLEGVDRIRKIVSSMKSFAHPDAGEPAPADLNKAIESTVTVSRNEWKYVAEMQVDLDPDLPPVTCMLGAINQVVLNLIVNAAHAIREATDGDAKGRITVSTRRNDPWAEIHVSDTGTGIPAEARERIFDPFFTTKAVGQGTGQGLAIAHAVVTEKHAGRITFKTELGRGTTFTIQLPLDALKDAEERS